MVPLTYPPKKLFRERKEKKTRNQRSLSPYRNILRAKKRKLFLKIQQDFFSGSSRLAKRTPQNIILLPRILRIRKKGRKDRGRD